MVPCKGAMTGTLATQGPGQFHKQLRDNARLLLSPVDVMKLVLEPFQTWSNGLNLPKLSARRSSAAKALAPLQGAPAPFDWLA